MKKLSLTVFTALLFSTIVSAQYLNYDILSVMDYVNMTHVTSERGGFTLAGESIEGSPYLNDEFVVGTIYTSTKQKIENIQIRYNIYNDDLEFKSPNDQILAIADPATIELADFGEYKMTYISYSNSNRTNSAFLKMIESGKATLYAKPDVAFKKADPGNGIVNPKPAQFIERPDSYYIKTGETPATKIDGKKDIISLLEDHSKEVSDYIKKNKVKTSKEAHLKKLVQYYNSL